MTRISGLMVSVCAALMLTGAAQASLAVGITEDAGKTDGGASFFSAMKDVGLTVNRISINWDPSQPSKIQSQAEIQTWMPEAQATGARIIFSVAPRSARDLTSSPMAASQFVSFLRQVATTFPTVKDFVVGNEPNQPLFWLPQFNGAGKALAADAYERVLAQAYDTLKAVDPRITVIGVGLSPRGNDNPKAKNNVSRSPVRFLRDLGAAYRASHRNRALMDELAFHPYPSTSKDALATGYRWPNAGAVNLDRIKQAVWDAFHGTSQPTFAEPGVKTKFPKPLLFDLDEVGWQVGILPGLTARYVGTETNPTTSEAAQASIYSGLIKLSECDSTVRSLNFFHLADEADLGRWQSGLERVDGSHRPSYAAVKDTLAQTHGNCQGRATRWTHAKKVVKPLVAWGALRRPFPARKRLWSFVAGAGEGFTFRAGVFKAGSSNGAIGRRLATGRPKPLLMATGTINATPRVVRFPARRLKRGRYVYGIRLAAAMNPQRVTVLVSKIFRVGR